MEFGPHDTSLDPSEVISLRPDVSYMPSVSGAPTQSGSAVSFRTAVNRVLADQQIAPADGRFVVSRRKPAALAIPPSPKELPETPNTALSLPYPDVLGSSLFGPNVPSRCTSPNLEAEALSPLSLCPSAGIARRASVRRSASMSRRGSCSKRSRKRLAVSASQTPSECAPPLPPLPTFRRGSRGHYFCPPAAHEGPDTAPPRISCEPCRITLPEHPKSELAAAPGLDASFNGSRIQPRQTGSVLLLQRADPDHGEDPTAIEPTSLPDAPKSPSRVRLSTHDLPNLSRSPSHLLPIATEGTVQRDQPLGPNKNETRIHFGSPLVSSIQFYPPSPADALSRTERQTGSRQYCSRPSWWLRMLGFLFVLFTVLNLLILDAKVGALH